MNPLQFGSSEAHAAVVAVDLGGTRLRVARFEHGRCTHRIEQATPARAGPAEVLAHLGDAIGPLWHGHEPLAVAITGRVRGGVVDAVNQETMPGWAAVDVQGFLERTFAAPVVVMNDAHAAAWGEACCGAGVGVRSFAFVTVSTGVGAGLVLEARPLQGARGLAAHLGFVPVSGGQALEHVASGTAIAARASERFGAPTTTREVLQRAAAGDRVAEAVIQEATTALLEGLRALRWCVDPERVAIGGSVGLSEGFLERLAHQASELVDLADLPLVPAALGQDAGLVGASRWPLR